jgi:hypothetical protein
VITGAREFVANKKIPVAVARLVDQATSRIAVPERDDGEHAVGIKKKWNRRVTE